MLIIIINVKKLQFIAYTC